MEPITLLLLSLSQVQATPIVFPAPGVDSFPSIPKGFCYLTPEYGEKGGTVTFLEDCPVQNLTRYDLLPMIADQARTEGVHPKVCCPEYLPPEAICTPSDAWCPSFKVSWR